MFMKNHKGDVCSLFGGNKDTFVIGVPKQRGIDRYHPRVADAMPDDGSKLGVRDRGIEKRSRGGGGATKLKRGRTYPIQYGMEINVCASQASSHAAIFTIRDTAMRTKTPMTIIIMTIIKV